MPSNPVSPQLQHSSLTRRITASSHEPKNTKIEPAISSQDEILDELRKLTHLYKENLKLAAHPPITSEVLYNYLLQLFALVVGTLFGVFAVFSWQDAQRANDIATAANGMASAANQIGLAAYCQGLTSDAVCLGVQLAASQTLSAFAMSLYGVTVVPVTTTTSIRITSSTSSQTTSTVTPASSVSAPTSASTPTSIASAVPGGESASSQAAVNPAYVAAGVLGTLAAILAFVLPYFTWRAKRRRFTALAKDAEI